MEVYLLVACLNGACEPAYTAYVAHNKPFAAFIQRAETTAQAQLNYVGGHYWLPIALVAAKRPAAVKIIDNVQLLYSPSSMGFQYSHNF